MNSPIPTNGDAVQQIIIVLDQKGNLNVSAPQNKIIAFGMLEAAKMVIAGHVAESPPAIVPVTKFIPPR